MMPIDKEQADRLKSWADNDRRQRAKSANRGADMARRVMMLRRANPIDPTARVPQAMGARTH